MATTTARALDGAGGGFDAEGVGGVGDGVDAGLEVDLDVGGGALARKEVDNVAGGAVAEELAEGLFVVGNAVALDEGDEVLGDVAGEGGAGEVGVFGEEVFGGGAEIGEVGAASSGDEDLFADSVGVVEDEDAGVAVTGFDGAHEACGSGSEDGYVDGLGSGGEHVETDFRLREGGYEWRGVANGVGV